MKSLVAILLFLLAALSSSAGVVVGSKAFTEGYVLGEIARRQIADAGVPVTLKAGLGNTGIVWVALKSGQIDFYCDYTGTISEEILKKPGLTLDQMNDQLEKLGIRATRSLGFKDNYGLVVTQKFAEEKGIRTISDLAKLSGLRYGLTPELVKRSDGWDGLRARYGLKAGELKTIAHELGYRALASGSIDVKDCYTTDAAIATYKLKVLEDDRSYFPLYEAVFLYRESADPKAIEAIKKLEGTMTDNLVIRMNAAATKDKDYAKAANLYFAETGRQELAQAKGESLTSQILRYTGQHLALVGVSLALAILVGVPLGIVASRPGATASAILGIAGVMQTIPSLALLALLVPISFLGTSPQTAVVALLLYSLLPIIRNTAEGLRNIPGNLRESAAAMGLESSAQMRKAFLPMALPTILAGIETSAVINVGTATLAAFIGGGGLGTLIVSGLQINDDRTILAGAIPAAVLAILVQALFKIIERLAIPRGLRARS